MSEQIERPGNILTLAEYRERLGTPAAKAGFEIRAAADDAAEVWLYGEVGWEITAPRVISQLKEIDEEGKTVVFRINSPGGDVFEGYALGNYIEGMKAETVAQVDGLAASMASFLAVCADKTVMHANSMMMIHEPWTWTIGDRRAHEASAVLLGKLSEQMVAAYERKRENTLGEVAEGAEDMADLVAAETWLTAEEAVAVGLADEILGEVAISACVRADTLEAFRNAPESVAALVIDEAAEPDQEEIEQPEAPVDPVVEALKSGADAPVSTAHETPDAAQSSNAARAPWLDRFDAMRASFGQL